MKKYFSSVVGGALMLSPLLASASVESSMQAVQSKLVGTVLPLGGMLSLGFAAVSFFMGSPNAVSHLKLAIIGAGIGFGGPAIIDFVRGLIH